MKPQLRLLIDHFKSGKTLTCFTAYSLGIGSLTKRISEIKELCSPFWLGMGHLLVSKDDKDLRDWEVWDEWVEQSNGKRHKIYGMAKREDLAKAMMLGNHPNRLGDIPTLTDVVRRSHE